MSREVLNGPVAIRFEDVGKTFGKTTVLEGVTFQVDRGEFFGLAGGNGAGKTTLLKCLLDICEMSAGVINIFGISNNVSSSRSRLAFMPERFLPPCYLSGKDFVRIMLDFYKQPYDRQEVNRILTLLDLDISALDKSVSSYSKGMTQKLGLAACFLSRKELYILDEPMSGLDPKARALLKLFLNDLRADGRTILFTSHSMADIHEVCDRMAILHEGTLKYVGTPGGCCDRYDSPDRRQQGCYPACSSNCIACH